MKSGIIAPQIAPITINFLFLFSINTTNKIIADGPQIDINEISSITRLVINVKSEYHITRNTR